MLMEKRLVQIKTRTLKVIKALSTNIFLLYWSKGFVFALYYIESSLCSLMLRFIQCNFQILMKSFNQYPSFPQPRPFFAQTPLPLSEKLLRLPHLPRVYHPA